MAENAPDTAAPDAADPRPMTTMTSAMLKAYANPLRRRILKHFAQHEFVRAADIAAALDEPANKVSFHLRVLADAGLIQEAPERARDRRDRVWTPIRGSLTLADREHGVSDVALGNVVLAGILEDHEALVRRIVARMPEYFAGSPTLEERSCFSEMNTRLTPTAFEKLIGDISALVEDARVASQDDPDARPFEIHLVAADDTI
ncbi:hypothetical protein GCM10025768_00780 [Microbacterium pseudoresistens]|uniref:DNA-binding transcriptional ArsR family regulator n=1 Tax=Microbacterium pseudoresistens TaxID=640634 RepID=A0A7Y9EU14_9MICO|nr:helix-turn-helix domain-containing protein [Microbacterium pseudoresistens]NYD53913.1 DNA-binding transcriptional ArsR family regulator [Microbacterium pseudoresistens]